jgi:hypothetical protein
MTLFNLLTFIVSTACFCVFVSASMTIPALIALLGMALAIILLDYRLQ